MNFFRDHKKIFLIIGFLLAVLILGYLIWLLFFSSASTPGVTPTATGTLNGLPTAGSSTPTELSTTSGNGLPSTTGGNGTTGASTPSTTAAGGLTQTSVLTTSSTLGSTLSATGGVQYYNTSDGKFYRLDKNGNLTTLSDKTFYDVQDITWSPDKNKAVLTYPDGSKIMYNFQTQKQVTLPSYWQNFSFSADSNQLVAKSLGVDSENNWLVVSNADGSQAKNLENIGENQATVYPSWSPNNQIVAMYTQGVDFNRQEIYFVGLNNENFKSTVVEGRGLQSQWSTTGDRLLYSVYSSTTNSNPELWIVDAQGDTISQNRQDLSLQTWASKCTFSSNTEVYCAVPESLPQGAGMFPELADTTKDDLYKIDLTTGTKELVAVPDGTYNISQLMVSSDSSNLYFTDKQTSKLYQIKLK
jgi:hypothetical protein